MSSQHSPLITPANANKSSHSATIQLWYGPNQSLLELELIKWLQLFRLKYPQALVRRFDYEAGREAEIAAALHQGLNSSSLFAQKIFISVRGALATDPKGELATLFEKVCFNPSPDLVLVLVESGKITWTKPLAKIFKKAESAGHLKTREFADMSLTELERWISARVNEQGGRIAPSAARQVAYALGNDFMALDTTIAKLLAWSGSNEISAADVDLLVTPKIEDDIFSFVEAVGRRDIGLAQKILSRQFSLGVNPQSLIGLLSWHVRVLALIRQALDSSGKKLPVRQLADDLGLHSFVVSKTLQQIPYYSTDRIAWFYNELSQLDIKLKSSRLEPEVLFSVFLSKLSVLKPAVF